MTRLPEIWDIIRRYLPNHRYMSLQEFTRWLNATRILIKRTMRLNRRVQTYLSGSEMFVMFFNIERKLGKLNGMATLAISWPGNTGQMLNARMWS